MQTRPFRPASPLSPSALAAGTLLAGALALGGCTIEDFMETSGSAGTTQETVVAGLRAALEVGIDSSAFSASKVNGYLANAAIKILLPEEAGQALDAARQVADYVKPYSAQLKTLQAAVNLTTGVDKSGFTRNLNASASLLTDVDALQTLGDSVVKYMNRAAEIAAPRSVPIFKGAITGLTIADGLSLLNSRDSTAATAYLNDRTFHPLAAAYTPVVDSTLALVPLTRYWGDFRALFNAILANYDDLHAFQEDWNANAIVATFGLEVKDLPANQYKPITTASLGAWTTDKALTGLFHLVGEEEKDIRRDPLGYAQGLAASVGDLLKEVFGEIMEMQEE